MRLVEVSEMPKADEITEVPLDNALEIHKICLKMVDLCEHEKGIGLSAVQVGIPWKLFIVKSSDNSCALLPKNGYGYFVNCDYREHTDEKVMSLEGCLSIRSDDGQLRFFQVERHKIITLYGFLLDGLTFCKIENVVIDLPVSIVFQHEADHGRGVLISSIGREMFLF